MIRAQLSMLDLRAMGFATLRNAGSCVTVLYLAALTGCSSEPAATPCPEYRLPEVNVFDARTGERICDATVTISNNGDVFTCVASHGGCAPNRCNGPKLGGDYALRVKSAAYDDFERVITFDDSCDENQFELQVALEARPGDGGADSP